mmetsp:Transcript_8889/g.20335  ORF Transcript_8889/g.20335 Transcript_8889/m.20335 type:complete len:177 (-) Transcript_8889:140-670(-)
MALQRECHRTSIQKYSPAKWHTISMEAQEHEKAFKSKCNAKQDYGAVSMGSLHKWTGEPFVELPRTRFRLPRTGSVPVQKEWTWLPQEPAEPGRSSGGRDEPGRQQAPAPAPAPGLSPGQLDARRNSTGGLQRTGSAPSAFCLGSPLSVHAASAGRRVNHRVDYRGLGRSFTLSLT